MELMFWVYFTLTLLTLSAIDGLLTRRRQRLSTRAVSAGPSPGDSAVE